jgi:hypothetical protein
MEAEMNMINKAEHANAVPFLAGLLGRFVPKSGSKAKARNKKAAAANSMYTPKSNKNAVYTESGWVAEVEIITDDSDAKQFNYTLRVVQTLAEGYLGSLHDGHIFSVFADKQHLAYCGWSLSKAREDGI